MRGPGEFLGTRQTGLPAMRIANLISDAPLLDQARSSAEGLLNDDPEMGRPENRRLWEEVAEVAPGGGPVLPRGLKRGGLPRRPEAWRPRLPYFRTARSFLAARWADFAPE